MSVLAPLHLAEWYDRHRASTKYDLIASSASPISVADLLGISERKASSEEALSLHNMQLAGEEGALGSVALRRNLAALYSARAAGVTEEDIIITSGAASANYTVLSALLNRGDHVIVQHPMDEVLSKIPASLGAEITLWKADPAKRWKMDIEELKDLIKENTKMIILQNPCDPSGAIIPKPLLEDLISEVVQEKGILIVADETYRPLFHSILPSNKDFPPSTINLGYQRVLVTGSVDKAYSLAGTRVGWIACKNQELLMACKQTRRYNGAQASRLDETVAAEAVSDRCIHALLARNIGLCQTNLELLQEFVDEHSWACSWARPLAGTTAMLKFHKMGKPVDDEAFCSKLLEQTGVGICPARKCFGEEPGLRGYVRVAFGESTSMFKEALSAWKVFMEDSFDEIPTMSKT